MRVSRTPEARSPRSEGVILAADPKSINCKIKPFFFCGRVAERRCVPVREDCRAHEIGCDELHLLFWWTRIHMTAVGFLFSCHAEPGLLLTEGAQQWHQDSRGVFFCAEKGSENVCFCPESNRTYATAVHFFVSTPAR